MVETIADLKQPLAAATHLIDDMSLAYYSPVYHITQGEDHFGPSAPQFNTAPNDELRSPSPMNLCRQKSERRVLEASNNTAYFLLNCSCFLQQECFGAGREH